MITKAQRLLEHILKTKQDKTKQTKKKIKQKTKQNKTKQKQNRQTKKKKNNNNKGFYKFSKTHAPINDFVV